MKFKKPFNITLLVLIILSLAFAPRVLIASQLLPNVSPKMEKPEFWIKKIKDPGRILLTSEEIQRMNEENLKRQELFLCKVKDLKEEWTKEEILSLLREDWEGFWKTEEVRYGRNGIPLGEPFWSELKNNLNQESLKERNQLLFGLIVKRTDIRVFPTDERSMSTPTNHEFDRFQHSSVSPGSLIGIYHFSKDRHWAYVQTGFIRGWVRIKDLAIAKEKSEVQNYEETKERLLITGNFVNIFGDPILQQPIFMAQMGTSFPLISVPGTSGMNQDMSSRSHIESTTGNWHFGKDISPRVKMFIAVFFPILRRMRPARPSKCFTNPMVGERCTAVETVPDLSWICLPLSASSCHGIQNSKPRLESHSVRLKEKT